jgi:type II secretory pathway component GspD/PulD (secretin)
MQSKAVRVRLSLCAAGIFLLAHTSLAQPTDLEARPITNAEPKRVTRTFGINANTFQPESQNLLTKAAEQTTAERVREFLTAAGLDFTAANPPRIFLNERTGILLIDATLAEVKKVEAALKRIAQRPLQVRLETRIAEVPMDAKNPELRSLINTLFGTDPLHSLLHPLPATEDQTPPTEANLRREILTAGDMRKVMRALEAEIGVDLMSAPNIVTISGRQARVTIESEQHEPITDPPFHALPNRVNLLNRGTTE